MKKCFRCNKEQPLTEFYKHKQMGDGYLNKCKNCTKSDAKKRHYDKYKDPKFVELERERGRDKYKRLNYKEKQKVWNENKPWTQSYIYKNLSRDFKIPKGYEFHHWSYKLGHLKDGFIMPINDHKQLHVNLIFMNDLRIFKTKNGVLLDTKDKHKAFIDSLNLKNNPVYKN